MNLDPRGCCGADWSARETARLAMGRASGAAGLDVDAGALPAPLDGEGLEPLWDACQRFHLPVSVHLAGAAEREALARLAARRPALAFLLAHFGGPGADPAEMGRLLDRLPNVHLDLSARLAELASRPAEGRALLLAHADRLLFGTNVRVAGAPPEVVIRGAGRSAEEVRAFFQAHLRILETRDPAIPVPGAGEVAGLGLPRAALERIYHGNAERLLGFRPEGD
jgi:predicted TIM-barrel fold metal-dependent hydrolase